MLPIELLRLHTSQTPTQARERVVVYDLTELALDVEIEMATWTEKRGPRGGKIAVNEHGRILHGQKALRALSLTRARERRGTPGQRLNRNLVAGKASGVRRSGPLEAGRLAASALKETPARPVSGKQIRAEVKDKKQTPTRGKMKTERKKDTPAEKMPSGLVDIHEPDLAKKRIFTTGDAARLLKVAPRTVMKWFDSGRLKGYRIPGSADRRIPREQLKRFIEDHGMALPPELTADLPDGMPESTPEKPNVSKPAPLPTKTPEPTPPMQEKKPEKTKPAAPDTDVAQLLRTADVPVPKKTARNLVDSLTLKSSPKHAFARMLNETGYYTDGKVLLRLPEAEAEKARAMLTARGAGLDKSFRYPKAEDFLEKKHHAETARILGAIPVERSRMKTPEYLLEDGKGRRALVQAHLVKMVTDRYPDADMHLSGREDDGPVVFRSGGKIVAVVMPFARGPKTKFIDKFKTPTESGE